MSYRKGTYVSVSFACLHLFRQQFETATLNRNTNWDCETVLTCCICFVSKVRDSLNFLHLFCEQFEVRDSPNFLHLFCEQFETAQLKINTNWDCETALTFCVCFVSNLKRETVLTFCTCFVSNLRPLSSKLIQTGTVRQP